MNMKQRRDDDLPDGHLAGEEMRKVVRAQIRIKQPPETDQTYRRLKHEGYSSSEAVELITAVLAAETFPCSLKRASTIRHATRRC